MNLQNALYILAVIAIAMAAYFVVEMKVIDIDTDTANTEESLVTTPDGHSDDMMDGEDMMDEDDASSTDAMMEDDSEDAADGENEEGALPEDA